MSNFNRKGFSTIRVQDGKGGVKFAAVPKNGKLKAIQNHKVKRARKEAAKPWKEYKKRLKDIKKNVPLAERSKVKLSEIPERFVN